MSDRSSLLITRLGLKIKMRVNVTPGRTHTHETAHFEILSRVYHTNYSPNMAATLRTGATIPLVGLGTWQAAPGEVGTAVKIALEVSFLLQQI